MTDFKPEVVPNSGWDERLIVVRCAPVVDAYVVVTARFVLLVDTLVNPATARALVAVAEPFLAEGRTLVVLNTHADWDHVWGNQLFAGPGAAFPAPVLASRAARAEFDSPGVAPFVAEMRAKDPVAYGAVVPTPPTVLFEGSLTLDGGDLHAVAVPTPGHAPGHVSLWLPELGTLLAADAAEPPFPFARRAADLPELRASLARLEALAPDVVLYCHAPEGAGPTLLAENRRYFDRVEAACREALGSGAVAEPPPEADVAGLVGLRFEDAVPDRWAGPAVHAFYRTTGHAAQIRHMLAWLAGAGGQPAPEPPVD